MSEEKKQAAGNNPRFTGLGSPAEDEESCLRWEAALADLLDGTLSAEEEAALRAHASDCAACLELLREAGAGRDWVRLLHDEPPVVPTDLLGKILARTGTELSAAAMGVDGAALPLLTPPGSALPHAAFSFRHQREAGFVMTAAMAFFSIALTLSLIGFHLPTVHAAAHAPASLGVTASRQFFDTKKQVVSFYDNLRLVREMEAAVQDLRRSSDNEAEKHKDPHPQPAKPSARRDDTPAALPMLASQQGRPASLVTLHQEQADERNML